MSDDNAVVSESVAPEGRYIYSYDGIHRQPYEVYNENTQETMQRIWTAGILVVEFTKVQRTRRRSYYKNRRMSTWRRPDIIAENKVYHRIGGAALIYFDPGAIVPRFYEDGVEYKDRPGPRTRKIAAVAFEVLRHFLPRDCANLCVKFMLVSLPWGQ